MKFYSGLHRYYLLDGGIDCTSDCECNSMSSGTLTVDDLEPGDILLIETSGDPDDGPDHSALYLDYKNELLTIDGNSSNQVRKRTRDISNVHGVCRPLYNDSLPKAVISDIQITKNGNQASYTILLDNIFAYCSITVAEYSNGALIDSASKMLYRDDDKVTITVSSGGDTAKVFLWKSSNSLKPMCDSLTIFAQN